MPAPGTHPGLPRRMDAPNGAPVRHDAAPPGDGPGERSGPTGRSTSRARSAASSTTFEITHIPARPPCALRRFLRETRAAVGLTAAFLSLMVIGGAALIGDHLWMIGKRDLLKSAADAAVIAATFEMRRRPDSESDEDMGEALQSVAERYARFNVLENIGGKVEPEDVVVTLDIDRAVGTLAVSVKADAVDTLFAKRLFKDFKEPGEVTTKAGTERDATKTEVVLAMDITASMNQNLAGGPSGRAKPSRMTIVRRAARTLVDVLNPEGNESIVAIGVVPWYINVRLDETMRAAWERERWAVYPESRTYRWPYLAVPAPRAETWRMQPKPEDWMGCLDQRSLDGRSPPGLSAELPADTPFTMAYFPTRERGTSYQCRDLSGDSFTGSFRQTCYHGPTFQETGTPCPGTSCLQGRARPQVTCLDSDIGRQASILPLTRDMDEVRGAVDALTPIGGNTYSTMGLIWARRLLTPEWRPVWGDEVHPADPKEDGALGLRKVIVLLTDGEDNYGAHVGAAPDRSAACTAAKDAGIEIFVIAAMDPAEIGSDLSRGLTECSSQSDDHPDRTYVFLNNHSREALEDAFRQIALQLVVVRRTH